MSNKYSERQEANRRGFLKGVGLGLVAGGFPLSGGAANAQQTHVMDMPAKAPPATDLPTNPNPAPAPYHFFNADEVAFMEAAVGRLIPQDDTGPGAVELGAVVYIDGQLSGAFGSGDRMYLIGPFLEGTPSQGYQLSLTPAELIRAGIGDLNAYATSRFQDVFANLTPDQQATLLSEVDKGEAKLSVVPPVTFFNTLLQLATEGYFCDPMYGGNRGKAAWKMIGFPGALGMFVDKIEPYRNKRFDAEPVGIEDLSS